MVEERYKIVFLNGLDFCGGLCSIQDTNQDILTFYNDLGHVSAIKPLCDLLNKQDKEINDLKKEKDSWKGSYCNCMSFFSILSNELSILQETKDIDGFVENYYKYYPSSNYENKGCGSINDRE